MSTSSRSEALPAPVLRAWLRERVEPVRFAGLSVALAGAGAVGAPWPGPTAFAGRAALALLLVVALRLLDDLVDRERDRLRAAERVLPRARSTRPFVVATVLGLGAGAAALASLAPVRAAGLALLLSALACWYAWGSRRPWPHALVLLAKYPALAILVGASDAALAPRVASLAALYTALVLCERATDPDLR